jgi:hypothetical protein
LNLKTTTAKLKSNLFYFLISGAILARVYSDLAGGRFGIASGELFPYRHSYSFLPIYNQYFFILEIIVLSLGGFLILDFKNRKYGLILSTIVLFFSLMQMFQNQKVLLFIVLFVLCLQYFVKDKKNIFDFLKWQLILVYMFTGLSKINSEFLNGEVLAVIMNGVITNQFAIKIISVATVCTELILPLVLFLKPKLGFIVVVIFHLGLSLFMDNVLSFGLTSIALAWLFNVELNK